MSDLSSHTPSRFAFAPAQPAAPEAAPAPSFGAFLRAWLAAGLYPLDAVMISLASDSWDELDAGQRASALAAMPDLARILGARPIWAHGWLRRFNPLSYSARNSGALP